MKKALLFLLTLPSFYSYAQKPGSTDAIEHRVDVLICKKEYTNLIETIEKDSLEITRTEVKNGIAKCHYGRPARSRKQPAVVYTITYDTKKDKIISVTKGDK
jgi:hypothetical protein